MRYSPPHSSLAAETMSIALHATCFDASALTKLYVNEAGSEQLRLYWRSQATRYTTPFCFYETLSILKGYVRRGALTREGYLKASSDLVAWFRTSQSRRDDIEFFDIEVFSDVKELADEHDLDLSDAFQLLTLQAGYFSVLVGDSATLLVTADEPLARAARAMRLPVWDCIRDPMPSR